jgi:hypothetical protein
MQALSYGSRPYDEAPTQPASAQHLEPDLGPSQPTSQQVKGNVDNDPFLTHQGPPALPSQQQQPEQLQNVADNMPNAAKNGDKKAPLSRPKRDPRDRYNLNMYCYIPWFSYVWTLLLWMILKHFAPLVTLTLTCFLVLGGLMLAALGCAMPPPGKNLSYLYLGVLVSLFAIAGTMAGKEGWNAGMRQYWWLKTGQKFDGENTALTPASSKQDAAWINFWDAGQKRTFGGTRVDINRAAGYRSGGATYCVAPLLSPEASLSGVPRVEYWTIGVDCCTPGPTGAGYHCDATRLWNGGKAVPLIGGGWPCAGCNKDKFEAAVKMAEAGHDLMTATGALLVRWVTSVDQLQSDLVYWAVVHFFIRSFVAFISALAAATFIVNDGLACLGITTYTKAYQD